jgi:peptidoglycan/LPS O-acetylase OafA/YrhL
LIRPLLGPRSPAWVALGGAFVWGYNRRMTRPLRALASVIAAIVSMVGVLVYEHYSLDEPPGGGFTMAIATPPHS